MSLHSKLAEIDLQLEVMSKQNRQMLYASVFIGVVALVYYLFGVDLQAESEAKEESVITLEKKLAENRISLYEKKIAKEQEKILLLSQEYREESYKANALRTKLEGMDYLSSDAKGLADILERILKHSVVLNVNIDKISLDDEEEEYKAQIIKRGKIRIEGSANFSSVLKLMRFIESQEALIEIENVHFDLKDKRAFPSFFITITGYGISI